MNYDCIQITNTNRGHSFSRCRSSVSRVNTNLKLGLKSFLAKPKTILDYDGGRPNVRLKYIVIVIIIYV